MNPFHNLGRRWFLLAMLLCALGCTATVSARIGGGGLRAGARFSGGFRFSGGRSGIHHSVVHHELHAPSMTHRFGVSHGWRMAFLHSSTRRHHTAGNVTLEDAETEFDIAFAKTGYPSSAASVASIVSTLMITICALAAVTL